MKRFMQKGMTLVEMMIGMALGIVLTAGIIQIVVGSKTSYSTQQAVARVQESGRLAIEYLSMDVRQTGYMGCMTGREITSSNFFNLLNSADYIYDFGTVIEGFDNVASVPVKLGSFGGVQLVSGTDMLVIRAPTGSGISVASTHTTDANLGVNSIASLTDTSGCPNNQGSDKGRRSGLCDGDILMLSNCSRVVVFQATNVTDKNNAAGIHLVVHSSSGTPGNTCSSWGGAGCGDVGKSVNPGDEIMKLSTYTYFIGVSARTGRPGLFKRTGTSTPIELIEDVQSLQLTYGVDATGDRVPDSYLAASAVADWDAVGAVRVQFLVQTPDASVLPKAQSGLSFNGQSVDTSDRRMRQVFTSTIALRNRAPQ